MNRIHISKSIFWLFVFLYNPIWILAQEKNTNLESNLDSTIYNYQQALETKQKESNVSEILNIQLHLGEVYESSGLYTEALRIYNEALSHPNIEQFPTYRIDFHTNLGRVHLKIKNLEIAISHFKNGLKLTSKRVEQKKYAILKGYLGSVYEKQGEYLKALECQKESLLFFEQENDSLGMSEINENIGSIYEDLVQYETAHTYFFKAYALLGNKRIASTAHVLDNIGDVFRKTALYNNSLDYYNKALAIADTLMDNDLQESIYNDLSKSYALMGNYKDAYKYRVKAVASNEENNKTKNRSQLNALQALYNSKTKTAEIELLKEQNKSNNAQEQLLILVFTFVLTVICILIFFLNKKRKATLKLQTYKQQVLRAELDKKKIEESHLQHNLKLKNTTLSKYSLHLSQKNEILKDISSQLKMLTERKVINLNTKLLVMSKDIDMHLKQENEWEAFTFLFKEIHPDFIKHLSNISTSKLSSAELKLGMLLRLNLSSKEIAAILRVTPDSVRVARYRLRKKLPLESKDELVHFLLGL